MYCNFILAAQTESPIDKLRNSLNANGIIVDENILIVLKRSGWLSSRLVTANTDDDYFALYEEASSVPRSATRAIVRERENVSINGEMPVHGAQTAIFLYAVENYIPKVLKINKYASKTESEVKLFKEIGEEAEQKNLALVPVRILLIQEGRRITNHSNAALTPLGLLMPSYSMTLSSMPVSMNGPHAIWFFDILLPVVNFIHSKEWMHGDIKPSNIFIDSSGKPFLGDYGSSVKYCDLESFSGGTPLYQCADVQYISQPRKFDLVGLVLSMGAVVFPEFKEKFLGDKSLAELILYIDSSPIICTGLKTKFLDACRR